MVSTKIAPPGASERFPTSLRHRHRPKWGDPFRAGRIWRTAASLVGCDARDIAPSSLLAVHQIRLRADNPSWSATAPSGRDRFAADPVAGAAHGLHDIAGAAFIQLLAQAADMHVDHVGAGIEMIIPHAFQ